MPQALKPPPLQAGDAVRILSIASPVAEARLRAGAEEIGKLGFRALSDDQRTLALGDFFAGTAAERGAALKEALSETHTQGNFLFARRLRFELFAGRVERRAGPAENSAGVQRSHVSADFSVAEIPLGHVVRPDGRRRLGSRR